MNKNSITYNKRKGGGETLNNLQQNTNHGEVTHHLYTKYTSENRNPAFCVTCVSTVAKRKKIKTEKYIRKKFNVRNCEMTRVRPPIPPHTPKERACVRVCVTALQMTIQHI